MTIAITGSSGFLGKALLRILFDKKCKIICLVREESHAENFSSPDFITYSNKLNDDSVIKQLNKFHPDVFIHCAWNGTVGSTRNESYQLNYNIPLSIESVLLAHAIGCKQWIGTGSQAEYGNKNKMIVESDPANPNSLYGKAKLISGILALELCSRLNMKGVWNRIFSLYGRGDNEKYFIPYIINSLIKNQQPELTNCEQEWDYIYVDDAAEAIYFQILNSCEGIFNICSGKTESLRKVAELIQSLLGNNKKIQFGTLPYSKNQNMFLSGSSDKLRKETGWSPKFTLEEGLKQTINYSLKNESI
ncbi:MAG TPA: NAD(P)-dependent oxidoreductase [Bacteroidia bacterium]|nr:NAD(P)-dependent oxidoreductase [Bacteroidia bacterium]